MIALPRSCFCLTRMEDDNHGSGGTTLERRSEASVKSLPIKWSAQALNIHAVQCFRCGKYRRVPEKRKYEEIREQILSDPWECEFASQWSTEEMNCDLPDEFAAPEYVLIYDRPSIPASPPRWERRCFLRPNCSTSFADVYYYPPNGAARVKSKREILRYCEKFPGSLPPDFDVLRQTSFAIPRAPPGLWIRKKPIKLSKIRKHGKRREKMVVSRTTNDSKCDMMEIDEAKECEKEKRKQWIECEVKNITAFGVEAKETSMKDAGASAAIRQLSIIREFSSDDDFDVSDRKV